MKAKFETSSAPGVPGERLGDGRDDPAWRWHAALRRVLRGSGDGPVARPADAANDPDVVLLERYLRCRCGELPWSEIDPDQCRAVHEALRIWSDRGREYHTLPFELEAGVLAGLEPGALLPADDSTDALVQHCYESLFFDIRGRLGDREWLLRNVFASPWQTTRSGTSGFRRKVIAHTVGADAYAAWIAGVTGLPTVRRASRRFDQVMGYLNGVRVLGLSRRDDTVRLLGWLFADVESAGSDAAWERAYSRGVTASPDWRERLSRLAERIPAS